MAKPEKSSGVGVPPSRRSLRPAAVVGLVVLLGLLAGVAVWVLTILVSASNIEGDTWSLRGNGALVLPFALGPAVLAGGWTALALWRRGEGLLVLAGLMAGLLTMLIGLAEEFSPLLGLGPEAIVAAPLLALALGIGLWALFLQATRTGLIAAGVAWVLLLVAAVLLQSVFYLLGPLLVAPVLSGPLVASALLARKSPPGRQAVAIAGGLLLPVAFMAGLFLAGFALARWAGGM